MRGPLFSHFGYNDHGNHVNHVTTQLPYALLVAAVTFITYIIAGFAQNPWIPLPIGIVLLLVCLFTIKASSEKQG